MPLLNKIDLITQIQKAQLHKETLFISPMLNDYEKKELEMLLDDMISLYETALQRNVTNEIPAIEPETL